MAIVYDLAVSEECNGYTAVTAIVRMIILLHMN
jgi:hypothetical protein